MKKIISVLIALCLAVMVIPALAEGDAPEGSTFQWGAYELRATWVTTDRSAIKLPNLREDGLVVLVRLEGVGGPIVMEDIKNIQGDEFALVDTKGNEYAVSTWVVHQLITQEGSSFPSMAPEQDSVDFLFFMEGKTEADAEGIELRVGDLMVNLDNVPRELPAETEEE